MRTSRLEAGGRCSALEDDDMVVPVVLCPECAEREFGAKPETP